MEGKGWGRAVRRADRTGRRAALTATLGGLLCAVFCALPPVAAADAPRENSWDELMPKGWDPMGGIKRPPGLGLMNDADPRVLEMMRELREIWDTAPTRDDLDGKPFRLSGYVVPLEQVKGELKEFLLVPYFGACIHTPPPPANQVVHVFPAKGQKGLRSMDVVTVQGSLRSVRGDSALGASGYRMDAAAVEAYKPPAR
jgi:hypothetical protein